MQTFFCCIEFVINIDIFAGMVTVPISAVSQLGQKNADGQIVQKTIRLSATQMSNLKIVNQTPTKVQECTSPSPVSGTNSVKNYISPILDHSGSRKRQDIDSDFTPE